MALEFRDDINMLVIHIPNSEASVDAQHNGGKDTTVGSYYMSEMQPEVHEFLNDFEISNSFIQKRINKFLSETVGTETIE